LRREWIAAVAAVSLTSAALAETPTRTTTVRFAPAAGNGFTAGSVQLQYKLINCMGDIQVSYSFQPETLQLGSYRYEGKLLPGPAMKLETIALRATVRRPDNTIVGSFADGYTASMWGGCLGQSKSIGTVKQLIGTPADPAKIDAFLSTLTVVPEPMPALTSLGFESEQRAAAQREANAKAAADRAAAQQKAQADAAAKAAAAQQLAARQAAAAEAQRVAEARQQAQQAQAQSQQQAAQSQQQQALQQAQAAAQADAARRAALERQGELARQQLADQQRARLEAQQRAAEANRVAQQQTSDALMGAAASLGAMMQENADRAQARQEARDQADIQNRQALLAGKCVVNDRWVIHHQMAWGERIESRIDRNDCVSNGWWFYENYGFRLDQQTAVTIRFAAKKFSGKIVLYRDNGTANYTVVEEDNMHPGLVMSDHVIILRKTLPPGTYFAMVGNYLADSRGNISMTLDRQ
jgi:flagellar biosynthesis GTPase FlhF